MHARILHHSVFLLFSVLRRNENSSKCPLRALPEAGGKLLFACHLNRTQMFVQMDIEIHREGTLIHNRSLLIELVCKLFYLVILPSVFQDVTHFFS